MSITNGQYIDGKPYIGRIEDFNVLPRPSQLLRRNCLLFMQALFSQIPSMRYDSNDETTMIHIQDKNADILKTQDGRPKIITMKQALGWEDRGGIGNRQEQPLLAPEKIVYSDIVRGSCTIGCFAREDIVAEEIAEFVFSAFKYFRHRLRKFGFLKISSTSVSPPYLIKADPNGSWFGCNVQIAAQMQDRWAIEATQKVLLQNILVAVTGKVGPEEISNE